MKRLRLLVKIAAALTVVSCGVGGGSPAQPSGPMLVRPAVTTSVDVLILESFPVQVHARLTGELGDACTELLPITQTRNGNRVRLTVQSQRPRDAVCAQVLRAFDEVVALAGPFPPGDYVLEVNDVATAFTVD
jgi:inhibitor of cysteine peptidase